MNLFIHEALITGFKEGFKISVVWLVLYSYLLKKDHKDAIRSFYAGLFFAFLASVAAYYFPSSPNVKEYIGNFISMSFAVFLIASAASLYNESGVHMFSLFQAWTGEEGDRPPGETGFLERQPIVKIMVFLMTVLFFSPDSTGSVLFLKDLAVMKESGLSTSLSALAGCFLAFGIMVPGILFLRPFWIGRFFDLPQFLLFLAIVKLLGGGIKGVAEITLIPPIERGFMKFSHDFIHQTFVLVMVPDHPLLKTTVWNFIGFFFGSNIAIAASLFGLLFFPFLFLYHSLLAPLPAAEAETGARRRKIKAVILSDRRSKALPVVIFICLILATWFSGSGESVSRYYNPKPKPVVEDKGSILIPINDPTMDLMDGALHKFSLAHQGEEIRMMIIKRQNNTLAVCLDACEICPPDGYGQRQDMVFCIFCNTPIPVNTLGQPGGCNPIPLASTVDDRFVRIDLGEILKKWEYVKTGKSKEGVP